MDVNQSPTPEKNNQESMEIAAFVLGICSLLLSMTMYSGVGIIFKLMLGLVAAVVGLILGIRVNKVRRTKMGTTAIITSALALCLYLVSVLACSACALVGCAYIEALIR